MLCPKLVYVTIPNTHTHSNTRQVGEGKNRWPTKSVNRCPKGVTNEQTKKGFRLDLVHIWVRIRNRNWIRRGNRSWNRVRIVHCRDTLHGLYSNVIMSVYSSPYPLSIRAVMNWMVRGEGAWKGSYFSYNWAPTTARPQTRKLDAERKQIELDWFFFLIGFIFSVFVSCFTVTDFNWTIFKNCFFCCFFF